MWPLTVLATVILAAGVVARGMAAHRVPWGNMYEFCTTGALMVAVVYLIALTRKDLRFLGSFVIGLVVIMLIARHHWIPDAGGPPDSRPAELLDHHPRLGGGAGVLRCSR